MFDSQAELSAAVYGELYSSAVTQKQMLEQNILQYKDIGFASAAECAQFAKENKLDVTCYLKSKQDIYNVSHNGTLYKPSAYESTYKDVLFYSYSDEKGKEKRVVWHPDGIVYNTAARSYSEEEQENRKPLYHRDYFRPYGFYDDALSTFNIAEASPVFAKETGRDTSHIYTLIDHIAGECAPWLLAWLRHKLCYPTQKTEVIPIFVSRAQGSGKTTFAEVICKGLFGTKNVVVTSQFDAGARFNSDVYNALIVCQEEREEQDSRNTAALLKSLSTGTTIRVEHKGIDPDYKQSVTDYILTTNKDIPIKFEGRERQRRFMVMATDENFVGTTNALAEEVFAKLYGKTRDGTIVGKPFVEDPDLIAQFKHELFINEKAAKLKLESFPETAAYKRCFNMPRTVEAMDIEATLRSLAPFIKASLENCEIQSVVDTPDGERLNLHDYITTPKSLTLYIDEYTKEPTVALCRTLLFINRDSNRAHSHANVERTLIDAAYWLLTEYGIVVSKNTMPLENGFPGITTTHRHSVTARFVLARKKATMVPVTLAEPMPHIVVAEQTINREGKRLRVNNNWQPDPNGAFETVNELKPGVETLANKSANVAYMDTFLFEADQVPRDLFLVEKMYANKNPFGDLQAERLFYDRLRVQNKEADRLFNAGIAARVVYSGGKSIHIVVRVKDSPQTLEEYKWLHGYLCTQLTKVLVFDQSTADPARLTRAPITCRRTFEYLDRDITGEQHLIHENWAHVYDINWRVAYEEWQRRPLSIVEQARGRRLVPMRKEFMDAMHALLDGTFWSDQRWKGYRQYHFFPAYRLCRMAGFTHDELWGPDGVLEHLDDYKQANERQYWRDRESCALIAQIDREVDEADAADRT